MIVEKNNSSTSKELIVLKQLLRSRDVTRNFEKRTFLIGIKCLNQEVLTSRKRYRFGYTVLMVYIFFFDISCLLSRF